MTHWARISLRRLGAFLLIVTLLFGFVPVSEAQADIDYFPQTGHYLRGFFRDYWYANGGVTLFGYPITPEYVSNETGLITQYFERARFELIEGGGFPTVQLGALGREISVGRIFPKAPPVENSADRRYVPETQYIVKYGFKEIWERYGEAAFFGYPISNEIDEVLEDGTWHTVQYFERFRFEYWPEFPDGERVLFSNLGRILATPSLTPPLPPGAPPEVPVIEPEIPGVTTPPPPATAPSVPGPTAALPPLPPDVNATVTPRSGPPGTVFQFEASGFQAEEEVGIWLNGPEGILRDVDAQIVTDSRGMIPPGSLRIETDLSFAPGTWSVNAQGLESEALAVGYFRIGSGADIIAPAGDPGKLGMMIHDQLARTGNGFVSPIAGPSGTPFILLGDGYYQTDRIESWVTRPDEQSELLDPTAIQFDQSGGVQVHVTTAGYPPGEYAVAAQGAESGVVNSAAFVITSDYVAGPGTPLPPSSNGSATPEQGGLGTVFQIRGEGLSPTEEVEFWVTEPTGTYTLMRSPLFADAQGLIGSNPPLDIVTTNMFAPGIYGMHFRGKASGVRIDIYFHYTIPGTEPPPPEPEPEPTDEPEPTAEPEPTTEPETGATTEPEPTDEPTTEPEPTDEPTTEPEPTAEPEPEPQPAPPASARCPTTPRGSAPNRPVRISLVSKQEEVVELWNVTGEMVRLDGWTMCSVNGNQVHWPIDGFLGPGEKKRFAHAGDPIWDDTNRDDGALFNVEGELISYWVDTTASSTNQANPADGLQRQASSPLTLIAHNTTEYEVTHTITFLPKEWWPTGH